MSLIRIAEYRRDCYRIHTHKKIYKHIYTKCKSQILLIHVTAYTLCHRIWQWNDIYRTHVIPAGFRGEHFLNKITQCGLGRVGRQWRMFMAEVTCFSYVSRFAYIMCHPQNPALQHPVCQNSKSVEWLMFVFFQIKVINILWYDLCIRLYVFGK